MKTLKDITNDINNASTAQELDAIIEEHNAHNFNADDIMCVLFSESDNNEDATEWALWYDLGAGIAGYDFSQKFVFEDYDTLSDYYVAVAKWRRAILKMSQHVNCTFVAGDEIDESVVGNFSAKDFFYIKAAQAAGSITPTTTI